MKSVTSLHGTVLKQLDRGYMYDVKTFYNILRVYGVAAGGRRLSNIFANVLFYM